MWFNKEEESSEEKQSNFFLNVFFLKIICYIIKNKQITKKTDLNARNCKILENKTLFLWRLLRPDSFDFKINKIFCKNMRSILKLNRYT